MKDVVPVENVLISFLNNVLVIDSDVLTDIKCIDDKIENGGVLYGFKILDKNEYVLNGKTYRQEDDSASICNFERKSEFHLNKINEIWRKDNSTMYLGDWHYHPVDYAYPSQTDYRSFENVCKQCRSSSEFLFFIISAHKEFVVYIYEKKKSKLITTYKVKY